MQFQASRVLTAAVFVCAAGLPSLSGQSVISAQSGVVQYVEGSVLLNGHAIDPKFGHFPTIKNGEELRTEEGRAEILLTPGVFLRLGENSSVRMISSALTDTRVEFLGGSALVEATDILKDNAIAIVYKDRSVQLLKDGLYRFDSNPARVRVYDGEAVLSAGGDRLTLKHDREAALEDTVLNAQKFSGKSDQSDELYLWSQRRDSYVSMANVSAAQSVMSSGSPWFSSGWAFNPFYGMYTFVPYNSMYFSPFGYGFWSPFSVYQAYSYYPPLYGYYYGSPAGGGGGGGLTRNSGGQVKVPANSQVRLPQPIRTGRVSTGPAVFRGGNSAGAARSSGGHFGSMSSGGRASSPGFSAPAASSSGGRMSSGMGGGRSATR